MLAAWRTRRTARSQTKPPKADTPRYLVARNTGLEPIWKRDERYKPALEHWAYEAEALGQKMVMDIVIDELDATAAPASRPRSRTRTGAAGARQAVCVASAVAAWAAEITSAATGFWSASRDVDAGL